MTKIGYTPYLVLLYIFAAALVANVAVSVWVGVCHVTCICWVFCTFLRVRSTIQRAYSSPFSDVKDPISLRIVGA